MLEPPPPPAAAATTGGSSKDRRQQQLKSTPVNPSQPQCFSFTPTNMSLNTYVFKHLFRCKWFDTINPKNLTTRNRRSYIEHDIQHILTDREFHKNNQYILATQVTQVFYLEDLARQPRGWKVVEHVYHQDVAESDQDVIHGSGSSHVTLSVGLTCLEHTDLSINTQSIEVDAPPVNDDNANANEDNADFINNEDDVVVHVIDDDDDDVEVPDDDEVNPSTNVEEVLSSDDSDDDN
ncbi:acidic leucine-rich nuclear phosphoprotein 32 family member A [Tanacetum coccineum]